MMKYLAVGYIPDDPEKAGRVKKAYQHLLDLLNAQYQANSPWQNGIAERFVGNCRRDLLDHVIVLNERHLKRLMTEYVRYYNDDRTHLALEKQAQAGREVVRVASPGGRVISMPRLGGLHHRYDLAA